MNEVIIENSIEFISFIVTYEMPFDPYICENLLGLKDVLSKDFPVFNKSNSLEIQFDNEQSVTQKKINGILMQKMNDDGSPAWKLHAEGSHVIISCFQYTKWDIESKKALKTLSTVMKAIGDSPIKAVALKTVDKFHNKPNAAKDIFHKKSTFLPGHIFKTGELWHVHQGWFADESDLTLLNMLNISTAKTKTGRDISTTIDHSVQAISPISHDSEVDMIPVYNALHKSNKDTIRKLLKKSVLDRIGL